MPQRLNLPVAPHRPPAAHLQAALAAVQAKPAGTTARPSPAAHVQAALALARQKAPLPPPRPQSVQARFPQPPVVTRPAAARLPVPAPKGGSTVQPAAALVDMRQAESAQSTYLTATLINAQGSRELASNLASTAAGHSEDRLIDAILPAAATAGYLEAKADNLLMIGINRSPCSSTDRAGNGQITCNKGGTPGCAERLIHLAQHGFAHMGTTYPITVVLSFRQIYGDNSAKQANSVLANEAMVKAGIQIEMQQAAGPTKLFYGTGAMKQLT